MWSAAAHAPVSMPMKGGNPVFSTKTGTDRSAPTPTLSTSPADAGAGFATGLGALGGGGASPAASSLGFSSPSWRTAILAAIETMEAAKRSVTVCVVDSCPFIQSIVVVTSPIGVHTPPACKYGTRDGSARERGVRHWVELAVRAAARGSGARQQRKPAPDSNAKGRRGATAEATGRSGEEEADDSRWQQSRSSRQTACARPRCPGACA